MVQVPTRTESEETENAAAEADEAQTPETDTDTQMAEYFASAAAEAVGADLSSEEDSSESVDEETGDPVEEAPAEESAPAESSEESEDSEDDGDHAEATEEETDGAEDEGEEEQEATGDEEEGAEASEASDEDDEEDRPLPEHQEQDQSSQPSDPQKAFQQQLDALTKAYKIPQDLEQRIEEEGVVNVLPDLLARTHMAAVQQVMNQVPQVVDQRVTHVQARNESEERFFRAWPQVRDFLRKNPEKQQEVERLAEWYKQRPGLTEKKYIRGFGQLVAETYDLPLDVEEETGEEATGDEETGEETQSVKKTGDKKVVRKSGKKRGKRAAQKPFKPSGKGASGRNQSSVPDNWFAQTANELGRGR